jgi:tRNA 2-thiouridine synthesizing protein A
VLALSLIGVYDFQRMNQVIITFHVQAAGEIQLSPELAEYKLFAPADLRCWPAGTGLALADWLRGRGPRTPFIELPPHHRRISPMEVNRELDTRGLNCPLPILKAKKALADMVSGETLRVVSTDAGSLRDFQAFARQTGNELLEQTTVGSDFMHVLRRR